MKCHVFAKLTDLIRHEASSKKRVLLCFRLAKSWEWKLGRNEIATRCWQKKSYLQPPSGGWRRRKGRRQVIGGWLSHAHVRFTATCVRWGKVNIISFLQEHNVPFPPNSKKEDLVNILVSQCKNIKCKYAIELICEKLGVSVLRLPPYHCYLNPIELAWSQLKRNIRKKNKTPQKPDSVISHVVSSCNLISSVNWKNYCRKIVRAENESKIETGLIIHDSLKRILVNCDEDED